MTNHTIQVVHRSGTATSDTVRFYYSSSPNNTTTNTPIDILVTLPPVAPSTTSVSSSAATTSYGASVTLTATISGNGSPTGTVAFQDNGTAISGAGSVTVSNGQATFTTSALSVGSHSIVAVYAGDPDNPGSTSGTTTVTVTQNVTTTFVQVNPSYYKPYGAPFPFVATIVGASSSATGTVTFYRSDTPQSAQTMIGTASVTSNGSSTVANFSTTSLPTGQSVIWAVYSGDSNNAGSASDWQDNPTVTVAKLATTTSLSPSATTPAYGASVTLTATVAGGSSPSGAVTFMNGATTLGTGTISGTTATLTTASLPAGANSLTAVYAGDAINAGSTSSAATVTVSQAPTSTAVSSSLNPAYQNQAISFSATVTSAVAGSPTGSVTFLDGGTAIGSAVTLVNGQATLTTSGLTSGNHTITTSYSGDSTYAASTSSLTGNPQVIIAGPAITAVTPSSGPVAGANSVVISGSGFDANAANNTVMFGSTTAPTASITSASTGSLTVNVPSGSAGQVDVSVTVAGTQSRTVPADKYTYIAAPIGAATTATVNQNSSNNPIALSLSGGTATSAAVTTQPSHGTTSVTNATITYTPTANYAGTDSFQYTVTNIGGTSTPAIVSLTVQPNALTATQNVSAAIVVATGGAITPFTPVTGAGGSGSYSYAVTAGGSLPAGLSMAPGTGTISGTPSALLATTSFTVTVTDTTSLTPQTATNTFQLTVNPTALTTTTAVSSATVTSGSPITAIRPVTASGGFGTLTYALRDSGGINAATLPAGLSFSTQTGSISGNALALLTTTAFTVTVTDSSTTPQTSSKTFQLTVNPSTLAAAQFVASTTLVAGSAATTFTPVTASGGYGTLTFALSGGTLPTGLSFSSTTGAISGTPRSVLATTTFTVTVTDQTTPTKQTAANSFSLAVAVGAPASIAISTGGSQSATISTGFSGAMSVVVKDAYGDLVSGASVTFAAPASGASGSFASNATVTTNASGIATAPSFTANSIAGSYAVTASVSGAAPVSFSMTNTAGAPAAAGVNSGNGQSAAVSAAFSSQLSIAVTDNGGNPLAGVPVTFTAPSSGASGTFSSSQQAALPFRSRVMSAGFAILAANSAPTSMTVNTNSAGIAAVYFRANTSVGSYTVVATANGLTRTFSLSNVKAANTITFAALPTAYFGMPPFTISATATSGDTVSFASLTPSVCTVSGATVTLVARGTCQIQASDPGNATYSAATSVTQSFAVSSRFDPSKDAEVIGIVTAETQSAEQFADIQISNFNQRLEQMHGDGKVADSFGISIVDGIGPQTQATPYADDSQSQRTSEANSVTAKAMRKGDRDKTGAEKLVEKEKTAALDRAFSFWTAGAINVGRVHANNTVSTTDLSTAGLSAGIDYRFNRLVSIGLGLGYGATSSDIGSNGSKVTGRNYDAILYASIRPTAASFVDAVVGAGLLDYNSSRYITGVGSFANGKRTGYEAFGSLTAGIEMKTKDYLISPYARVEAKTGTLNAFDETAVAPWALHFDKETFSTASVNLGIKAAIHRDILEARVSPFLRAEFQHDLVNNTSAGVTYVDQIGISANTIAMPGSDQNRVMIGVGTEIATANDFRLTLEYLNTFSTSSSSDASTFRAKVTKTW
ncbi:Ig-like domain repeat protein [Telmatospirillum sp.]|uniref:Ig-like domain repeat protein n=1 Tax=Telmatospirillum sp. TaxID=2079197 RepID=UPI00284244C7|nr:Ig-like domain repeat protein [Telmatospirillum sp.]MDR3437253.1 Ig-like domain repeat protein [Telmatospirillum sp.]